MVKKINEILMLYVYEWFNCVYQISDKKRSLFIDMCNFEVYLVIVIKKKGCNTNETKLKRSSKELLLKEKCHW